MRIVYLFFVATLLWSFYKVLVRLRGRHAELTPILGWIIGLGFFILVPFTVMVFNGGYEFPFFYGFSDSWSKVDLSNSRYFISALVIWMSLLFSFAVVILLTPDIGERRIRSEFFFNEPRLRRAILITAGLTIVDHVITFWALGGPEAFFVAHWYGRAEELVARLGDLWVLYMWVSQANMTVFTAAAALYTHSEVRHQKLNWRFTLLIFSVFLLYVALIGHRIFLALYFLSFVASCWIYRRKKWIAILLMIAPALALVFSAWVYFRNDILKIGENIPTYVDADLGNRAVTSMMDAFDGGGTMVLFHIINDFGGKYEYMYGASYARALFFMIPRSLYPEKPANFADKLGTIYEPGEITSFGATQLGELYANFGVLSVLLLPFATLLIFLVSEKLTQKTGRYTLLSAVFFLLSIWFARSTFADNFITLILALLLIRALRLERGLRPRKELRLI